MQDGAPTQDQAIEALLSVPREDRFKMYGMGGAFVEKTGDLKGYWKQVGESISRSVSETLGAANLMAGEAIIHSSIERLRNPILEFDGGVPKVVAFKGKTYWIEKMAPEERMLLAAEI